MTNAQRTDIPLDPSQALDIVFRLSRRLVDDLGVTIVFADVPYGDLGDFDEGTRILRVAPDATLHDQHRAYGEVLMFLVYGPAATGMVAAMPTLTLVPSIDPPRPMPA